MHVPSGLLAYGLYQNEQNNGTQLGSFRRATAITALMVSTNDRTRNETNVWFLKAGIKRTWMPAGATVIWGEGGQYEDQFLALHWCWGRLCVTGDPDCMVTIPGAGTHLPTGANLHKQSAHHRLDGQSLGRWHRAGDRLCCNASFARWQHLELDLDAICQPGALFNGNTRLSR